MNKDAIKKTVVSTTITYLWDLFCLASLVGIWPRFIEPNLLKVSQWKVKLKDLHPDLIGLKILQFSDLHLHPQVSNTYLHKTIQTINRLKPDLILFTGDLLCQSKLSDPERLKHFLCSLTARFGCFGVFGNHDYAQYVSLSLKGEYDVAKPGEYSFIRAWKRFFLLEKSPSTITEEAKAVEYHNELMTLLKSTPFHFLHNSTIQLQIGHSRLNICGLGDYWVDKCKPEEAFTQYDQRYPGIVLSHNPDTARRLLSFPGDIILCGHTHGGQVNLPWLWNKFTIMECPEFKRGRLNLGSKTIFVNRGLGSVEPFRWFSPPELTLLTLDKRTSHEEQ
jgi:predicted MPP superfamily phosphohydrolase